MKVEALLHIYDRKHLRIKQHWQRGLSLCHTLHSTHRLPAAVSRCKRVVQHELLQRLAPALEEAMHPFDCCAGAGGRRPASGFSKPLPISRRASAASHEDLHCLINQVCPSWAASGPCWTSDVLVECQWAQIPPTFSVYVPV